MTHQQQVTSSFLVSGLSDDLLGDILLYNDFETAAKFRLVSKSIKRRMEESSPKSTLYKFWRLMYDRQYFAPVEATLQKSGGGDTEIDYFTEIKKRRRLLFQLLQLKKTRKNHNRCFNLPNRCFHFKPIIPADFSLDEHHADDHDDAHRYLVDPPPVIYECESFVLTSSGTGDELVLLDPFDGRLSVIPNFSASCIASDEAVMDRAMFQAADAITTVPRSRHFGHMQENEIAGHCFEESFEKNQQEASLSPPPPPPSQELLSSDDYFTFDIRGYFPHLSGHTLSSEEFEMSFMGIDSKPIIDPKTKMIQGSMIALARSVTNIHDESITCSELTMWTKKGTKGFADKMVCRFYYPFGTVDFDPVQERVFVSNGQVSSGLSAFSNDEVAVLPMTRWKGDSEEDYYARSIVIMQCDSPIAFLIVDVSGETLLVATNGGTIEVWDANSYKRLSTVNIVESLRNGIEGFVDTRVQDLRSKVNSQPPQNGQTQGDDHDPSPSLSEAQSASFAVLRQQPSLSVFQEPVESIFLPKHLSPNQAGFVTLQHHRDEGASLLLWRPVDGSFGVVSRINLSLHSRRKPRVSFDGNRLVVFGEDHIGAIILIYQVSNGDTHFQDDSSTGEQSGGVYNFTNPPQIRFANRVRHAALGGIDKMDTIHMTTNERIIVVNTKTGNLLGGASSPIREGLLVIDLQDQGTSM